MPIATIHVLESRYDERRIGSRRELFLRSRIGATRVHPTNILKENVDVLPAPPKSFTSRCALPASGAVPKHSKIFLDSQSNVDENQQY